MEDELQIRPLKFIEPDYKDEFTFSYNGQLTGLIRYKKMTLEQFKKEFPNATKN